MNSSLKVVRKEIEAATPIIAAIYARKSVAGGKKDKQSLSIAEQIKTCTDFIGQQGWTVGGVYPEKEGTSGQAIGNRPVFRQLYQQDLHQYQVIVAVDSGRIARGSDLNTIHKHCEHKRVRILTVNDGFDSRDSNSTVDAHVSAIVSHLSIRATAARVHATLKMKAEKGDNPGGRPYGYKIYHQYRPA